MRIVGKQDFVVAPAPGAARASSAPRRRVATADEPRSTRVGEGEDWQDGSSSARGRFIDILV